MTERKLPVYNFVDNATEGTRKRISLVMILFIIQAHSSRSQPGQMCILVKTIRLAKPSSISTVRRNNLTSRAAMSTISDVIKKDHQEINNYANNIREAADDDSKVRWQNQFTWELARHSIGEELIVYPAFAKHLGAKGQEIADKDRAEHQPVCINLWQQSFVLCKINYSRSKKRYTSSKI